MSLAPFVQFASRLFPLIATSPFFAAYALFCIAGAGVRALRRSIRLVTFFRRELRCVHGHAVPVVGRYACSSCRSEYLGHIALCPVCSEPADLTRCPTCNVGVRLPWVSP